MFILVPATALVPSLSSLHGTGDLLTLGAIGIMFVIFASRDLVGGEDLMKWGFWFGRTHDQYHMYMVEIM